jgi:hypothetical protein
MTEPLFLCEMVWTTLWLVEWHANIDGDPASTNRRQALIAIALIAAVYTRYDGWIMAFLAWTAIGIVLLRRGRLLSRAFWIASAFVVAAPIAWFIYNQLAFGDWLDFARGPYSAKRHRDPHSNSRLPAPSRLAQPLGLIPLLHQMPPNSTQPLSPGAPGYSSSASPAQPGPQSTRASAT